MTNNIKLQEVCKQLHIPVVGTTSWPLPIEARKILHESNPCPFTAADIDGHNGLYATQRHRLSISLSCTT